MLATSSLLILVNWLTFIYSVESHQLVQASLGYFIAPLVNVLLGVLLLGERPRPYQVLSIVLAAAGVVVLTALVGRFPWVAVTLALSFALYALMRKLIPVDSMMCLAVETLLILPLGLAYLAYLAATGKAGGAGPGLWGLLMLSGPVTVVPLCCSAAPPGGCSFRRWASCNIWRRPAISCRGGRFRRAVFERSSRQFRLHLDGHLDLHVGLAGGGPTAASRSSSPTDADGYRVRYGATRACPIPLFGGVINSASPELHAHFRLRLGFDGVAELDGGARRGATLGDDAAGGGREELVEQRGRAGGEAGAELLEDLRPAQAAAVDHADRPP